MRSAGHTALTGAKQETHNSGGNDYLKNLGVDEVEDVSSYWMTFRKKEDTEN